MGVNLGIGITTERRAIGRGRVVGRVIDGVAKDLWRMNDRVRCSGSFCVALVESPSPERLEVFFLCINMGQQIDLVASLGSSDCILGV